MSGHTRDPAASRASRRFDGVLALVGMALLLVALVWMVLLVRGGKAQMPPTSSSAVEALAPVAVLPSPMLEDDALGVALSGRALRRIVQMLQWREVASVPLATGEEIVVDQGDYQLIWSERLIDSSGFAVLEGHVNPPAPPFRSRSQGAGAQAWSDADASAWRAIPATQVALPENLAAVFRAEGAWLLTTAPGGLPEPGDLRVRFEVLPEDMPTVSQPRMSEGEPDATSAAEASLALALRWIARAAAFVLAMLGAGLALRGFSRLSSPQSGLGRLRSGALLAISAWIAVAAALIAAWIARMI